jgi:hypothetical protein
MRKETPMANVIKNIALAAVAIVAVVMLAGCYTQMGAVRDDRDEGYARQDDVYQDNATQEQVGVVTDSTEQESGAYDDDEYESARSRFYYDYYYPSFTIGLGYYSWWRPWWGWGSGYYDPYYYGSYYGYWGWVPPAERSEVQGVTSHRGRRAPRLGPGAGLPPAGRSEGRRAVPA